MEEITVEQEMDMAVAGDRQTVALPGRARQLAARAGRLPPVAHAASASSCSSATTPWVPLIDGPIVGRDTRHGFAAGPQQHHPHGPRRQRAAEPRGGGRRARRTDRRRDRARSCSAACPRSPSSASRRRRRPTIAAAGARPARHGDRAAPRAGASATSFTPSSCPARSPARASAVSCPTRQTGEGLPELVLLGGGRNLSHAPRDRRAQTPDALSRAHADASPTSRSCRAPRASQDVDAPRSEAPRSRQGRRRRRCCRRTRTTTTTRARAVQAAARRTSYSLRANGRVIPGCYEGVLRAVPARDHPRRHDGASSGVTC